MLIAAFLAHFLISLPHQRCLLPDEDGTILCEVCEFRHHHPITQICHNEGLIETLLRNLTGPAEGRIVATVVFHAYRFAGGRFVFLSPPSIPCLTTPDPA